MTRTDRRGDGRPDAGRRVLRRRRAFRRDDRAGVPQRAIPLLLVGLIVVVLAVLAAGTL